MRQQAPIDRLIGALAVAACALLCWYVNGIYFAGILGTWFYELWDCDEQDETVRRILWMGVLWLLWVPPVTVRWLVERKQRAGVRR